MELALTKEEIPQSKNEEAEPEVAESVSHMSVSKLDSAILENSNFPVVDPVPLEDPIKVYKASDLLDLGDKTFDISLEPENKKHHIG
jgi:hypothetical protein